MRAAQYQRGGRVVIIDLPEPVCPEGGLIVQTEACGLCSGELMDWYMDRKAPHILGHEVCGVVVESQNSRFSVGTRVFVHHHAPCMTCPECKRHAYVHCPTWKKTHLNPGGMAERFAVAKENLTDAFQVGEMDPRNAALIEPVGCVVKSMICAGLPDGLADGMTAAIIGLGSLGVAHLRLFGEGAIGYDHNPDRREWAAAQGLTALAPEQALPGDVVFVLPGSEIALRFGMSLAKPGGRIVLFAPLPPSQPICLDFEELYFRDLQLSTSYSCGPPHTARASELLEKGRISYGHLVSDFVSLDELPAAYAKMKVGEIFKAMVIFE